MTTHTYAFKGYDKEKMAKAVGRDLPISTKHSIEICNFIRGKDLQKAKGILEEVIAMYRPVPFNRFTEGAGHKRGHIAGGRYPVKASKEILGMLNSVEMNAQQKGLDTSNLTIMHICANKAAKVPRYGRIRGRLAKRSHIEIVAAQSAEAPKKKEHGGHRKAVSDEKAAGEKAAAENKVKTHPDEKSETPKKEHHSHEHEKKEEPGSKAEGKGHAKGTEKPHPRVKQ